tara:strand:- start:249 stop:1301 length:1053 start_codon:yes stop_codon:yes gene_type:complete
MTLIVRLLCPLILFSFIFCLEIPTAFKYEASIGYDDNFMRFSDMEINTYHIEENTQNDYLGDSNTYDSDILSSSIQIKLSPKFLDSYKTNYIFKTKYNYYGSSELKSYFSLLTRFEIKLASYSWIKFSYSLLPDYYLRTYIDRDLVPIDYYPCYFSNETIYISYSHKLPISKTWADYRFVINNQFYNKYFTEFDSKIYGFELTLKSKKIKSYYSALTFLYYNSDNISYDALQMIESAKMDRSYIRNGVKIYIKKTFKNLFLSNIGFKFYFNHRYYDLDSWFYNSDNWKAYFDYDFRLEASKKINKSIDIGIGVRHFSRDVDSSNSSEVSWVEGYKSHKRNELWLKLIYNF